MKEHAPIDQSIANGAMPSDSDRPFASEKLTAEQKKIAYRLAEHIDENGRYSDAIKPIALGFAAAKGITEYEARQEIDRHFTREFGQDMKAYLDKHRADRGMSVETGRKR